MKPQTGLYTSRDVVNCRAAMYTEKDVSSTVRCRSLRLKPYVLRETAIRTHKKEDFLMFCNQTVSGEMAIFTTSSNLRVLCACDVLLMDETFKSCPRYFTFTLWLFSDMRLIRVFILCIRLTLTLLRFWRYELRFYLLYICAFVENIFAFSWQFFALS